LSAALVAIVAVRNDSQLVAAFGLVSVLIAPPILGASPDSTTLAFVGVVLVGTTAIARWRSWSWLPAIAFVLTAPQAASWIGGHPPATVALVGMGLYWALNLVAAGGEEFRRHRDDLSPSASTVLLGNAAFVVWAGFATLSGDLETYRGAFLVVVATAHLAVGGWFVARHGEGDLFGLLTLGTGIAALTMAMPVQFGATAVPIAWTAEAVALAWVAVRRGHPYSLAVSGVLYVLAAGAIMNLYQFAPGAATGAPFLDERGAALAFFVGGIAAGVWFLRDANLRSALAALGLVVTLYAGSTELSGVGFVAFTTGLMVVAAATARVIPHLPHEPIAWRLDGLIPSRLRDDGWRSVLDPLLVAIVVGLGAIAALHIAMVEFPAMGVIDWRRPAIPFIDEGSIASGILIVGVLVSGWVLSGPRERGIAVLAAGAIAVLAAGAIAAYIMPFQVEAWAVTVGWVGLGVAALFGARRTPVIGLAFQAAAGIAIGMAALLALGDVAPISRLIVGPEAASPIRILQSIAAIGAVVIGALALGRARPEPVVRRSLDYAASVVLVYLASVVAVDIVGFRVGGDIALDELRTQGQVVLSVLWALLGLGGFVYGIRSESRDARLGGLALLGAASVKVFLFDLAALDVAYRVISFIALGILLLIGAWLWQRAQPKPAVSAELPLEDPPSA
jgi:uncharacterized membrane protein